MTVIGAQGVSYRVKRSTLVDDVVLSIDDVSHVAIIGPNGAGKSTLVKLLAGELEPSSGSVVMLGDPMSAVEIDDLARRRAVLTQGGYPDIPFRVAEVVAMGRHPHRRDPGAVKRDEIAVEEALEAMDVGHLRSRVFATLSGGEQTRVSIARVLAQESPVVLLDEPTTALDIDHEERVMEVIAGLVARGTTVVSVLHDLNLAARWADRVVVIDRGRIVADGPPASVVKADLLSAVYRRDLAVVDHPLADRPLVLVDPRNRGFSDRW